MIRVMIVDDSVVVRQGLKALIATAADMKLVGEAGDGQKAVDLALALRPDIITMDLVMPGIDGIAATRAVRSIAPKCRVLILSNFGDPEQVADALQAGARGYLLKDAIFGNVLQAIRTLYQGYTCFHPSVEPAAALAMEALMARSIPPDRCETVPRTQADAAETE